jgi:hypothetical protein
VRVGWVFIGLGVGSALLYQHLDSVVWGGFMVLVGVALLMLKDK